MRRQDREVDDRVADRAYYLLDDDASCRQRAGDVVMALESGALDEGRIRGEIDAVIAGDIEGRTSDEEITAFKSLGVATQDLYLGAALLDRAEADGVGAEFDPVEGVVGG